MLLPPTLYRIVSRIVVCVLLSAWPPVHPVWGQGTCGVPEPTPEEVQYREQRLSQIRPERGGARADADGYTYIPVRFHVIRRTDGTGGVSVAELNSAFATFNRDYQGSGIQYYMAGTAPHYIDSDAFYDYQYSEETALAQGNDLDDAVNVYIPASIDFNGIDVTGYAYYPSILASSNRVFIKADRLADGRTLPHEMGHYFNLLHTFHNNANPSVSLRELVTRGAGANCTTAGDLLCDTPADPYGLVNATTAGCTYTGTVRDANNELFKPALDNMMSYYYLCGNRFTPGQYARMADGLLLRTDANNQYTLDYAPATQLPTQVMARQNDDGVLVTFSDPGSGESGFVVERATGNAQNYVPIAGLAPNVNVYQDMSVTANTLYFYRVRVSNGVQYSMADTAQVGLFYCRPGYLSKCSPVFIADFILSKNGTNLISELDSGCGEDSYSDFSDMAAPVVAGQTYTFTARAVTGGNGTYFDQHLAIWVDVNRNGRFETSERLFQSTGNNTMTPTLSGTISIPANAEPGPTRLRVRSRYKENGLVSDACGTLQFGEVEDYTLNVSANAPAPTITVNSVGPASVCQGGSVLVAFSTTGTFGPGNVFKIQLSEAGRESYAEIPASGANGTLTGTLPTNFIVGTSYKVRVVASQPVVVGAPASQLLLVRPRAKAVISGGGTIALGDSVPLTVTRTAGVDPWQFTLSDGTSYSVANSDSLTVMVAPAATTVYNLSQVQNNECGIGNGSGTATVDVVTPTPITLQLKVFLEGPYQASIGLMATTLNQRGLLPGQIPIGPLATTTPPGQPYAGSPWSYGGPEQRSNYQANIVDWILISLRENSTSVANTVYRGAALLQSDGGITLVGPPPALSTLKAYYVVIEHRNHLGVMSAVAITPSNGALRYDFSIQESYTASAPISIGQKQIGTVFAMHGGDGNKNLPNQNFVINVSDYVLWLGLNGRFDLYSAADYNLDARVSASDKVLWGTNNSKFSLIGRQ